jgi:Fur family peroxide stress response transcriptional regulator
MDQNSQLIHTLQNAGMRVTPQRLEIYRMMATTKSHPTAQMIYNELRLRFPSLSLATVYNTLEAFVNLGIINVLGTAGDEAVHYDADTSPHINLACVSCHRVIDLPSKHVHALDQEISANSGYKLLGARVMYYGLCPECQAKGRVLDRE